MKLKNFPFLLLPFVLLGSLLFFFWKGQSERRDRPTRLQREDIVQSGSDQQFQKFKLTGFDETGKSSWKLEGDQAKIDPGQTIFLDQNVTLRLRDQTVVRTDHVQWSQGGGTMRTNSWVYVDHENAKVRGKGAYGRPNEGFIQLNRDIEMNLNLTTRLVCKGPLKIFYQENRMIFYRNVVVTDAKGILKANRMDVTFDPADKKIREITAIGRVIIERGADTTRSQRAIYSVDTGSIRLEGNPEITLHKGAGGFVDGTFGNAGAA